MDTPSGSACRSSKRVSPWKAIFSHTMLMSGRPCSCTVAGAPGVSAEIHRWRYQYNSTAARTWNLAMG